MPTLTIYTPTYNRAALLPRVYASLCRQSCKDFLWLVVDDGSTDNTQELVQSWIDEQKLEIRYIYKENGGVHTARDLAYHICDTELITACDSDDWLVNNAVERLIQYWRKRGGIDFSGIFTSTMDSTGKRTCGDFPRREAITFQELTFKCNFWGDKHTVLRTDIIQQVPDAPVFAGEKLVGEGFKWIQLPNDKPFLLLDDPLFVIEYQTSGLSKNAAFNRFRNPQGFRAMYRQFIISSHFIKPRIKGFLGYIAFSLILRDRDFIRNSPKPLATTLFFPIGAVVYLKFKRQYAKYSKGD